MTPSEICIAAGLSGLVELASITGRKYRTLINWANNDPSFFQVVVHGAAVKKLFLSKSKELK